MASILPSEDNRAFLFFGMHADHGLRSTIAMSEYEYVYRTMSAGEENRGDLATG